MASDHTAFGLQAAQLHHTHKRSMVLRYAALYCSVILAGVTCIAAVLLVVTAQFYKSEKRSDMVVDLAAVVEATKKNFLETYLLNPSYLYPRYKDFSRTTGMQYTLVDRQGNMIACSEDEQCAHDGETMDSALMRNIGTAGNNGYFTVSNLNGLYSYERYVLAMPVFIGESVYYVVASDSAENLNNFLTRLTVMLLLSELILACIVFWLVYLATRRMLKPIKDMTEAAEAFGKGDFSKTVVVAHDDEIGRLAMSFNDMAYSLANLEGTRKAFVANVSHELKTPMTTIGGFVDGILDGTIPPEMQKHYLGIVSTEVSRLARLVRSMLNITKYETGEIAMTRTVFDITALTVQTVLLFEGLINQKNLEIEGLDYSRACYSLADMDLTQQIIYNLVENAVKFVNKGGKLTFSFDQDSEWVAVSIRNTGEGLNQEDLPRVFDRFYKTDESHGKDKTGVGLGLSIVRSIINLHGGQISVKSVKDEYTEFSFTLPGMPEKEAREALMVQSQKDQ